MWMGEWLDSNTHRIPELVALRQCLYHREIGSTQDACDPRKVGTQDASDTRRLRTQDACDPRKWRPILDPLLGCYRIDDDAGQYLHSVGNVFAEFGELTQDSGNISYGVEVNGERYFVKTAGRPDESRGVLSHPARVEGLRNCVRLRAMCNHHILPRLHQVIESPGGPLLVYEWLNGELLGVVRAERDNPLSSFQRFRRLDVSRILGCLDDLFDLHEQIGRAGWIAVDFYDGCLIYDFAAQRLGVIDLDMYRDGPFRNEMGRMFGSTRFMSPEEFELGALIDQRSNVFVMGRTALMFLSDGTPDRERFRGTDAIFEVVVKACNPERRDRFGSMDEFCLAWRVARKA
jgi:serine/threonine-protein kinase